MIVQHFGSNRLHTILPVENDTYRNKPSKGGLWTSPVDSEYSWEQWCKDECFCIDSLDFSFKLDISTDNLLKIDSYSDFDRNIIKEGFIIGEVSILSVIDFERLSLRYNGIWLTMKGQSQTRFSDPYNLYGWDCETVLLFNHNPIIKEL